MAAYMNFSAQTQVLSSLAGVPKRETCPKTWERLQVVPMLEKRQKGRARLKGLLRRPDSVPTGCGGWPAGREGGLRVPLPAAGIAFVRATAQAAALPRCALLTAA